eukprot:tig00001056_g6642.t1
MPAEGSTRVDAFYGAGMEQKIRDAKLLVVGAGGIGCELLKNLVLTGFRHIEVIDLDTIDVSNLNRQFLFRKEHVGRPKAEVARDAILALRPDISVTAHHASIYGKQFGRDFFQRFDVVLNALDNYDARRHVNRMCLTVDVPLVESGSTGYLGQVSVHKRGLSECYECSPKPSQKVYPVCTIRSTPDKPIHCVVFAKHIFNTVFGKVDPENPLKDLATARDSAESPAAFARKVFKTVFHDEIVRLLSMGELWKERRAPVPMDIEALLAAPAEEAAKEGGPAPALKQQRVWGVAESARHFLRAAEGILAGRPGEVGALEFDKDDAAAMEFVTATANLRAASFAIPLLSPFQAKEMAGNIIPAIASTNAVVAGLIVLQALQLLAGRPEACRFLQLARRPVSRRFYITSEPLPKPSTACYVCSKSRLELLLDTQTTTLRTVVDKVLRGRLTMQEPTVSNASGPVYECGEGLDPDEIAHYERLLDRPLGELGLGAGAAMEVSDQQTDFVCEFALVHRADLDPDHFPDGFAMGGDVAAATAAAAAPSEHPAAAAAAGTKRKQPEEGPAAGPSSSSSEGGAGKRQRQSGAEAGDDDLVVMPDRKHPARRPSAAPEAAAGDKGKGPAPHIDVLELD